VCALLLLAVCGVARARAQASAIDPQTFTPPAGPSVAVSIPDPELPAHGTFGFGLWASWASRPLVRYGGCPLSGDGAPAACPGADRARDTAVVSDLADVQLAGSVALFEVVQLGAVMPVAFVRARSGPTAEGAFASSVHAGDLRLSADAPLLSGDSALALRFEASLPTGDEAHFAGSRGWTALPMLTFRQRLPQVALAAALGYRMRQRSELLGLEQDDELQGALGASFALLRSFTLNAQLQLRAGVFGRSDRDNETPLEALVSGALTPQRGTWLELGAGASVWPGRAGYGAPLVRVFLALRQSFAAGSCEHGPEDHDGVRDGDHCRDPDNDGDGLFDETDACEHDAEDGDGFEDGDGCPDLDDDADGLADALDRCPRRSEDRDGFEDGDGCPELDNDSDGLADGADECAMDPEDRDRFEDSDGCPEPGPRAVSISVGEERILVSERIYFDYDADTLRKVSAPLLDQLAEVIRGLAPGLRVVVEGHTDESGNAAYNLDLSFRRAQAVVEYLKARGVPADRVRAAGQGATQPLGPNDSPDGAALNRRVEFLLMR
jgi:outer membrane protein OmpA-like peptidoglycan-associated protein